MSKTYRKDQPFRPKKNGRVFTKEESWKKKKQDKYHAPKSDNPPDLESEL